MLKQKMSSFNYVNISDFDTKINYMLDKGWNLDSNYDRNIMINTIDETKSTIINGYILFYKEEIEEKQKQKIHIH